MGDEVKKIESKAKDYKDILSESTPPKTRNKKGDKEKISFNCAFANCKKSYKCEPELIPHIKAHVIF